MKNLMNIKQTEVKDEIILAYYEKHNSKEYEGMEVIVNDNNCYFNHENSPQENFSLEKNEDGTVNVIWS